MSRYLLVKGCAGIGNRLFTLAAAIKYARRTRRRVIVDWRDGVFSSPGQNAFDSFFELNHEIRAPVSDLNIEKRKLSFYPRSLQLTWNDELYKNYRAAASKNLIKMPGITRLRGRLSRLSEFWQYNPGNNFGKQIYSDRAALASLSSSDSVEYGHKLSPDLKEDVVMFADYWPGDIEQEYFDQIGIKDHFKEKIAGWRARLQINTETIGVHVRSTDKRPGKKIDSLILELKKKKDARIFLATDNKEIEALFRDTFGENLLILPKHYPDDTFNMHHAALKSGDYSRAAQVYEESLTDIFLLAACGTFYYQGNSSFSRIALKFVNSKQVAINWLELK